MTNRYYGIEFEMPRKPIEPSKTPKTNAPFYRTLNAIDDSILERMPKFHSTREIDLELIVDYSFSREAMGLA